MDENVKKRTRVDMRYTVMRMLVYERKKIRKKGEGETGTILNFCDESPEIDKLQRDSTSQPPTHHHHHHPLPTTLEQTRSETSKP